MGFKLDKSNADISASRCITEKKINQNAILNLAKRERSGDHWGRNELGGFRITLKLALKL